uniref:DUF659 domain-containing protein n=1 Tax=Ditylenchus dipsaci TaxID=166011 RepID=A0A915CPB3_9BILA
MPGKANHWCWQYFDRAEEVINGKKVVRATCKVCPATYRGHATEMAYHLTNQCKKIGLEQRKTINKLAGIKQKQEEPLSKVARIEGLPFSSSQISSPGIANYFDRISEGEQAENRLINVIVHAPQPFLFDTIDATLSSHTGDFIRNVLSERIEKLGKHKIIAMVTDHAPNMRLAWELLALDYPWILFEGFKAHMVDLVAKDLSKTTYIADCIKDCEKIAKFFRKKIPSIVLKETQALTGGCTKKFQLPEPTRFSTYSTLISDVSSNEGCLKSAVWNAKITGVPSLAAQAKDLQRLVCNNDAFWIRVNSIKALLFPLAEAIRAIEGSNVNARLAYKTIKRAFDQTGEAVNQFDEYLQPQLLQILNDRREFGRTDVTYLMDLLEPSDRGEDLTEEEVQAAMELLANKILKNPAFITKENQVMIELGQWRGRTVDGLTFWTGFYSDSVLSVIYKALRIVQITAAPTERNWSLRGAIHTKMDVEMASKLTFIKHNLLLEHKDLFSRVKSSQENESEEAESEQEMEATEGNSEINDLLYVDDLLFESD